jgi:hypothetical protein
VNFKEWLLYLENSHSPGDKMGLYPPGYGGIALYPPAWWVSGSSDAITYMPKETLQPKFLKTWAPPPKANHDDYKYQAVQYKIPD